LARQEDKLIAITNQIQRKAAGFYAHIEVRYSGNALEIFEETCVSHSLFTDLDLIRLPDGWSGAVSEVWHLGEACEIDVGNIRETRSADELAPTN
jgi:hypothetical protein